MQTRRNDERPIPITELFRILKGLGLSFGVALVFYVIHIPELRGAVAHGKYILLCLMYGFTIYLFIWALYLIQRLLTGGSVAGWTRLPFATHFFLSVGGTALGLYVAEHLDERLTGNTWTFSSYWESILISVFIALMFQFYYAWKHSKQENLELKAAKAVAELHVLRNQMQPHFLFNSLNSLAALIDSDPGTAGEATQKLADLYRLILEASQSTLSPLERELQIARLYLEIERIRFGRRLSFLLPTLSPAERCLLVPSLVIQTLVENAVKHGVAASLEGGYVHFGAQTEAGGLRVTVVNSGVPLGAARGDGTGLRNTQERLTLAFGPAHGFRLGPNPEGLTEASFLIPEAPCAK